MNPADPTVVLGTLAVFVGLLVAGASLAVGYDPRRTQVRRSLEAVGSASAGRPNQRERELQVPFADRVLSPALGAVTGLGRRLTPSAQTARIRRRLDLAGNPPTWSLDRVASVRVLLTVIAVTVSLLLASVFDLGPARTLLGLLVLGGLAWSTPSLIVYQLAYDRSHRILRELPDALDLLTISVESGLGFDAALARVSRNLEGPLGQELARVLQEMQIGTGRMDALRAMADRTDVPDLRSFVAAMVQADAYGVPVAGVLRVQAEDMRVKRSQRAEEEAQKVPVKVLFPLIFGILPALFVVIIGPAAIQAVPSFLGL
ncbi:type II secretion system F family protein [Aquipuribacter nitratireducens]|uniref:Type II secretion system F family protein n=1 Tax=Aquipuribacter nitratireducens TaxID=650104 RepID=A0ABW0GTN3_9MICO